MRKARAKYYEYYGKRFAGGVRIWNYRGGFGISWEANVGFRLCLHFGVGKLWFGYFRTADIKKTKPFWKEILELSATIPNEKFDELPRDGASNIDHYTYNDNIIGNNNK